MKRKKLFIALTLFCSILFFGFVAGKELLTDSHNKEVFVDGTEEYKQLLAYFANQASSYDIRGKISLFDQTTGGHLTEQVSFASYKQNGSFYSQIGSLRVFRFEDITIQVDTVEQFISVMQMTSDSLPLMLPGTRPGQDIDTNDLQIRAQYFDKSPTERVLQIEDDFAPGIKQTVIYYNPSNFQITKTETVGWKNGASQSNPGNTEFWLLRTEMNNYNPVTPRDIKSESERFVQKIGTNYVSTPAYNNYSFNFLPSND